MALDEFALHHDLARRIILNAVNTLEEEVNHHRSDSSDGLRHRSKWDGADVGGQGQIVGAHDADFFGNAHSTSQQLDDENGGHHVVADLNRRGPLVQNQEQFGQAQTVFSRKPLSSSPSFRSCFQFAHSGRGFT